MATTLTISSGGAFELQGQPYRIPDEFSAREVYGYRRLLEPIPDVPGGTSLSDEQRTRQNAFFLRRAAACVVPGLRATDLERVPEGKIRAIHRWISEHRPELARAEGSPPAT